MPIPAIAANVGARLVRARKTVLPVPGVDQPRPYKRHSTHCHAERSEASITISAGGCADGSFASFRMTNRV